MVVHIAFFVGLPRHYKEQDVKRAAKRLATLSSTSKAMQAICKKRLGQLKTMYDLITKYSRYNEQYRPPHYQGPPQLLDAVATGCDRPLAYSTFSKYSSATTADIKAILDLMPQSLKCTQGQLKGKGDMPPLAMACFNKHIPIEVIKLLRQAGASFKDTYFRRGSRVTIISDVVFSLGKNDKRVQSILQLYHATQTVIPYR